jgi:hypothetical protein
MVRYSLASVLMISPGSPTFLETIPHERSSPRMIFPAPMGLEEVLGHEPS